MAWNPPGHLPGVHIPGTLTPIGAVVEEQRLAAQQAVLSAELAALEEEDLILQILLEFLLLHED